MPKSKHGEAAIIVALQQMNARRRAAEVGREVGVSAATIYSWKAKYGGMSVSEAQEAKQLRGGRLDADSRREFLEGVVLELFDELHVEPDTPPTLDRRMGDVVGGYILLERIGQGGMGKVQSIAEPFSCAGHQAGSMH